MMTRRTFLCGLTLGTLSAPFAVEAQTGKVYRIGYLILSPLTDPPSAERKAFLEGRGRLLE